MYYYFVPVTVEIIYDAVDAATWFL